jgi:osmotically-inducible protein OsmY
MLVVTILVTGAMAAEAHQLTRSAAPSVFPEGALRPAFAAGAAGQSDDLANKVKAALKADPDLSGPSEAVTVATAGGVVTLDGTLPTPQIRARLGEFVTKVDGVTKVVNKIKLAKK